MKDDARLRRQRGAHRREIVTEVARSDFDASGAPRLRRQRIHGERMLRINGVIARTQERLRRELEGRRSSRCPARSGRDLRRSAPPAPA